MNQWGRNDLITENETDDNGNPLGGTVIGPGIRIQWQNGPLGRPPKEPNGAFVEDLIEAARQRLAYYQVGKFSCRENALAITKLEEALHWLHARRMGREARGVQGENKP